MATAASPLRFISPSQLLLCLVLFFLPWIEVQCVPNQKAAKKGPNDFQMPGLKSAQPFASQSGLQVATGGVSLDGDMKRMAEMGGGAGGKKEPDGTGVAVLVFLYPVALVAGLVIGIALRPSGTRRIALAGCCGAAFAVLAIQAAIGFPIEQDVAKQLAKDAKGPQFGGEPEITMRVVWKVPLYATFLLLLTAAGTAFVDGGAAKPARPKDEFDDDDDEVEEDADDERPKRRRRREDD